MTDHRGDDEFAHFSCCSHIFVVRDPSTKVALFSVEATDAEEADILSQIIGPYLGFKFGREFWIKIVNFQPLSVPFFKGELFTTADRALHRRGAVNGKFPLQ